MHSLQRIAATLCVFLAGSAATQFIFTGSDSSIPCLGSAEQYLISLRWLQIFQTDSKGAGLGAALIDSTIAENFTYYDLGASFNDNAPVYDGKASLVKSISGTGYSGTVVTNVRYNIVTSFSSCDTAVVRWQSLSKAANGTGVTVPVGTPVEYEGTDYLQVDLSTRLIYNVTSSSDLLNYYIALGDDVIKAKIQQNSTSKRFR